VTYIRNSLWRSRLEATESWSYGELESPRARATGSWSYGELEQPGAGALGRPVWEHGAHGVHGEHSGNTGNTRGARGYSWGNQFGSTGSTGNTIPPVLGAPGTLPVWGALRNTGKHYQYWEHGEHWGTGDTGNEKSCNYWRSGGKEDRRPEDFEDFGDVVEDSEDQRRGHWSPRRHARRRVD
jgi:hypothetical protein